MLQCLFYSTPFRQAILNYPRPAPPDTLAINVDAGITFPDPKAATDALAASTHPSTSATTAQTPSSSSTPLTYAKARPNASGSDAAGRPDDRDAPDARKKAVVATLPILDAPDNAPSYGLSESLFTALKDMFETIVATRERVGIVRPARFLELLRRENEIFRTPVHQDAHEFLILLLDQIISIVESVPPPSSPPVSPLTPPPLGSTESSPRWLRNLFEGTLTSETQCLTCETVSRRDDVFFDLSVDLDQHSSVTSCLRKFSASEMLCERNKFHCDRCGGLQEAEKRMVIKRLPRLLMLHLKRFKYMGDTQRLQKLFHRVVYPYYLRLFNTTDDADDPDRLYELYGVVVHIGGGPYHGHYVAIIKTPSHGWMLYDDELVEPVDKSFVRNFFGDRPGLACAYMLFYQQTTFEDMLREQARDRPRARPSTATVKQKPVKPNPKRSRSVSKPELEAMRQPSPIKHAPSAPQLNTGPSPTSPTAPAPLPVATTKSEGAPIADGTPTYLRHKPDFHIPKRPDKERSREEIKRARETDHARIREQQRLARDAENARVKAAVQEEKDRMREDKERHRLQKEQAKGERERKKEETRRERKEQHARAEFLQAVRRREDAELNAALEVSRLQHVREHAKVRANERAEAGARDAHAREMHARETHSGHTHSRNTHSRDIHFRDKNFRDKHSHDTHSHDAHPRDTHSRDMHSRDTHSRDTHSRDTHSRDTHSHDTHFHGINFRGIHSLGHGETAVNGHRPRRSASGGGSGSGSGSGHGAFNLDGVVVGDTATSVAGHGNSGGSFGSFSRFLPGTGTWSWQAARNRVARRKP